MGISKEALAHGPHVIRVTVPASVAYNFDQMSQVTQKILNEVGCGHCHSGRWIIYEMGDNFLVNEKLEVTAVPGNISFNAAQF